MPTARKDSDPPEVDTDERPLVRVAAVELGGDFSNREEVWYDFLALLNAVPDLTVLTSTRFDFTNSGISGIVIIGESHAAIHTWPERQRAYALLASCSSDASLDGFVHGLTRRWTVLASTWHPKA